MKISLKISLTSSHLRGMTRSPLVWLVFLGLTCLYVWHKSPYVGFHDSLAFLSDALQGFHWESNATNHLLYNNTQTVLLRVTPFLDPVLVLTLFSVACTLGALLRFRQLLHLIGLGEGPTLMGVIALGLSFTFWQQAETIEVYALNNFLFVSFVHAALEGWLYPSRPLFWRSGLWLGLGLLTHIQNILSFPFFVLFLWKAKGTFGQKSLAAAPGILAFGILSIPVQEGLNSYPSLFFDNGFQGAMMGVDLKGIGIGFLLALAFLVYNFHLYVWPVGLGIKRWWKRERALFWGSLALFVPYFLFGVKFNVSDNHVFFLVPWILVAVWASVGMQEWWILRGMMRGWVIGAALVLPWGIYELGVQVGKRVPALAALEVTKSYKGGLRHFVFPGKRQAPDPLAEAEKLWKADPGLTQTKVEWRVEKAVEILRYQGVLSSK